MGGPPGAGTIVFATEQPAVTPILTGGSGGPSLLHTRRKPLRAGGAVLDLRAPQLRVVVGGRSTQTSGHRNAGRFGRERCRPSASRVSRNHGRGSRGRLTKACRRSRVLLPHMAQPHCSGRTPGRFHLGAGSAPPTEQPHGNLITGGPDVAAQRRERAGRASDQIGGPGP